SGAFVARLTVRNAQLDQALLGKQRQAGAGFVELAPVETGVNAEHLALIEPLLAGGGADRIAGLLAQQRLIAADGINRGEVTLQVFGELGGVELHDLALSRTCPSGRGR